MIYSIIPILTYNFFDIVHPIKKFSPHKMFIISNTHSYSETHEHYTRNSNIFFQDNINTSIKKTDC